MPRITRAVVRDVRFPARRALDGSDAMNPDPDSIETDAFTAGVDALHKGRYA